MNEGKCADKNGVVLEMFVYGGSLVQQAFLAKLSNILQNGAVSDSWYTTHFTLLRKGGDAKDANNWWCSDILSITNQILAEVLHKSFENRLDSFQSEDQYGFRKAQSTTHALIVLESVISKSIECGLPTWIVSNDLKKAFDRVEHAALF